MDLSSTFNAMTGLPWSENAKQQSRAAAWKGYRTARWLMGLQLPQDFRNAMEARVGQLRATLEQGDQDHEFHLAAPPRRKNSL